MERLRQKVHRVRKKSNPLINLFIGLVKATEIYIILEYRKTRKINFPHDNKIIQTPTAKINPLHF